MEAPGFSTKSCSQYHKPDCLHEDRYSGVTSGSLDPQRVQDTIAFKTPWD